MPAEENIQVTNNAKGECWDQKDDWYSTTMTVVMPEENVGIRKTQQTRGL